MSILPVIGRELQSQARQPLTYWLRLAGAGAICLALWLAYSSMQLPNGAQTFLSTPAALQMQFENFGVALFGKMNQAIFIAIWILTPLAAADSISRERREGTLPLLQLTRLRPWEIVLGKSFVHMLRSSTLFLTMLPWLVVPLLFGGVSLQDFQIALLLDTSALLLAQSAGLLASTFSRDALKTVIWAEALALLLLLLMMRGYESMLNDVFVNGAGPTAAPRFIWSQPNQGLWAHFYRGSNSFIEKRSLLLGLLTDGAMGYDRQWFIGGIVQTEFQSSWQQVWAALNPHGKHLWIAGSATILAGSIAIFVIAIFLGSEYVRRTWREPSTSAAWERLRQKYFTPKYAVTKLRTRLSRSLTRNPIGWLHHFSPSARLTKWIWCLFVLGIEMFFVGNVEDLYTIQTWLGFVLLFGVLFASAGSFRDELETGAFELLLVTPIREGQIVLGRVRGIWQQFLPAFAVYIAGALYLSSGWSDKAREATAMGSMLWIALLFFSAPFIGLYYSLLRWNFLVAWLCASTMAMLLPVLVRERGWFTLPQLIAGELLIAAFFAWRIRRRLQNRLSLSQAPRELTT